VPWWCARTGRHRDLACATEVYGRTRAAFYGLRSLVLTVIFAALVGEPRAEGLTRIDPVDLGRLLGLDRAPETKTLRRRMAAPWPSGAWPTACSSPWPAATPRPTLGPWASSTSTATCGPTTGGPRLPKAQLTRMRLSMPAEVDTWVADANGDGHLVWSANTGGVARRWAAPGSRRGAHAGGAQPSPHHRLRPGRVVACGCSPS